MYTTSIGAVRKERDDCRRLHQTFATLGIDYEEVDLADHKLITRNTIKIRSLKLRLPQVFVGEDFIADYDTVEEWNENGVLQASLHEALQAHASGHDAVLESQGTAPEPTSKPSDPGMTTAGSAAQACSACSPASTEHHPAVERESSVSPSPVSTLKLEIETSPVDHEAAAADAAEAPDDALGPAGTAPVTDVAAPGPIPGPILEPQSALYQDWSAMVLRNKYTQSVKALQRMALVEADLKAYKRQQEQQQRQRRQEEAAKAHLAAAQRLDPMPLLPARIARGPQSAVPRPPPPRPPLPVPKRKTFDDRAVSDRQSRINAEDLAHQRQQHEAPPPQSAKAGAVRRPVLSPVKSLAPVQTTTLISMDEALKDPQLLRMCAQNRLLDKWFEEVKAAAVATLDQLKAGSSQSPTVPMAPREGLSLLLTASECG